MMQEDDQTGTETARRGLRRWLPLGVLLLAVLVFFLLDLDRFLDFDELARWYGDLEGLRAESPVLAVLIAAAIYAGATAISVPAAWLLTVAMGLVFGWAMGAAIVVLSATLGASVLFLAAKTALADFFRRRAGPWLNTLAQGFRGDAASYLLSLRLMPVVPFSLLNVVPAILGVKFSIFFWTTLVGIIPGAIAYAFAGAGLRSVVAERAEACALDMPPCGEPLRAGDLVTPQVLIALFLLALVSLVPVVLKRLRPHKKPITRP
jgi:uncharacterized membrane protein YdjX (TVP38/TMEM64 family)